jgi:hypothetical protein
MRPIVVQIDAGSFGGLSGADRVVANLSALNIPVRKISCGDDLAAALSAGAPPAGPNGSKQKVNTGVA